MRRLLNYIKKRLLMKKIVLDGNKMTTIEQAHLYIKEQLDLPEYYGNNLDALWDILSVESTRKSIMLINRDSLVNNIGAYANCLINVFLEASKINTNITFCVEEYLGK